MILRSDDLMRGKEVQLMKNTGIVRRMDRLGRIVIPGEIRREFRLSEGSPIEIWIDGTHIMLRKYDVGSSYRETLREMISDIEANAEMPNRDEIVGKLEEITKLLKKDGTP